MNSDNPIFHSLALIEERIHDKLTVENLAESLHISKYHYQRIFHKTVGESVMRYVTRRRLLKAAEELAEQIDCTILEIALRYGYDTHEGFTRSFRAYMGVTPTEYRKYHGFIPSFAARKERCPMLYSKIMDEMLCELNALIIQAREVADYTRKNKTTIIECGTVYAQYWENISKKVDTMAEKLTVTVERITAIAQPDEISARFMIMKAMEETALWFHIIAFETGLTISRAKTEHRTALMPVYEQYNKLAQSTKIKTEKIAQFFNELSALIFQDIRKNAEEQIEKIAEKAAAAVKDLTKDKNSPYSYMVEEITAITKNLSDLPLDQITIPFLEDCLFRLDIAAFAADIDIMRMPSHKELFDGISVLREQFYEAVAFFQNLSLDLSQVFAESQICSETVHKRYRNSGFQGSILLFYLKSELQKLGRANLIKNQQAFDEICNKLNQAVQIAYSASEDADSVQICEMFQSIYKDMLHQIKELGEYAEPIKYIAENIRQLMISIKD